LSTQLEESLGQRFRWAVSGLLRVDVMPRRAWVIALVLLAPAVALRLFTSVYPFVNTVYLGFTDESPFNAQSQWLGFGNYHEVLTDPVAIQSLVFTVVFAVVSTVVELVVGLALALLLNASFRLRGVARAVSLIPWAIPAIVSALGFRFMFSEGFGIIPDLLGHFGIHIDWLTSPGAARVAVIATNVWRSAPFVAIIILAGLQGIPKEVYEAARVDGASYVQRLLHIVIPLVSPLLITMGLFMLIFQVGTFDVILGMTGGGPGTATQVLSYVAYKEAFVSLQYGRASAEAMILFLLVLALGIAGTRLFRRTEVEL